MTPQMALYVLTLGNKNIQGDSPQELSIEELSTVQGGIFPIIFLGMGLALQVAAVAGMW